MCGIVGIATRHDRPPAGAVERMNEQVVHRGPDEQAVLHRGPVSLGICRLSIIDVKVGSQPMSNEDGTIWVVFNGEIYNYQTLRQALERQGHCFKTHSDTETIIHAYEEHGKECVNSFNGMFAFAVWDEEARSVFLARDRLGVKPLYYYWDGNKLLFASEIKSILASGLVRKEVDPYGLWHYLTFRYVPAPMTIWRGIRKLPPGHRMRFDLESGELEVERYWDIHYEQEFEPMSDEEELRRFTELFLDAVRLRLISDVPVGIFLSGGLDSSTVAAAVAEVHNAPLRTFSVAFDTGGQYSELQYSREVSAHLGMPLHEVVIGLDEFVGFLPQFVWHTDEPLADPASIPLAFVSRLASQSVKVVLSGEGADEVLAGYSFDLSVRDWERLARLQRWPLVLRSTIPELVLRAAGNGRYLERLRRSNVPISQRNVYTAEHMTKCFSSAQKRMLWPDAPPHVGDSEEVIRGYYARAGIDNPLHQALFAYCQDWLAEDLLMKADKMTMASSIELRVPFLDYRLVEWLATRPPESKVRKTGIGQYQTKYLLRRFATPRLPKAIVHRSKQGFPVPISEWLAGPLLPTVRETLLRPDSWIGSVFDRRQLSELVEMQSRTPSDIQRLWLLFVLESWANRWL